MDPFMHYDFNINKIVTACFVPAGTGSKVHTNRPSHGLALNTAGEKLYVFSDGRRLTVHANDIIYLPKYSTYEVTAPIPGDCYAINFDFSEEISFAPFVFPVRSHPQALEYFKTAQKIWTRKTKGYVLKCKAELYNIIYTLQQEYALGYTPKSKSALIRPAVDYMHRHYTTELLSISALSDMCGITPEYFRSIFKKTYGVSPLIYINNLKLTHAKGLMETGMYSVTEAALQSGYTDMSHFSREFKKATGVCPSEFM